MNDAIKEVSRYLKRGKYYGLYVISDFDLSKKKEKFVIEKKDYYQVVGRKYGKNGIQVYGSELEIDFKKLTKKTKPKPEDVVKALKKLYGKKCVITVSAIKVIENLYGIN